MCPFLCRETMGKAFVVKVVLICLVKLGMREKYDEKEGVDDTGSQEIY